ncbi:ABC transporter ATP-binding protein [Falsirhodobacter halotolerans]|uniref:ABC transporter ATP-binding protein n=1 Tax=Falsirhodobacter halotolerans TaxID=1146892 RepID=UPI001FD17E84|nr:ABC transporter ATP-binding protein [Falsirhodobacter halotolerans]MCJ8140095.1 ABC transporter ATP-binding protein [Falsirhodobacter halotolerans]
MQPILSIKDLTVSFKTRDGWNPTVRNVGFDVMPGETVAIVGESGSGKSVTALSILQLHQAGRTKLEGEIHLNGRNLLDLSATEMTKVRGNEIGIIFQEPMTSLNPVLTIGEQLTEVLVHHRNMTAAEAKAEAVRLLERVRIPSAAGRLAEYPHKLSGGMRQRVMIAMALACKPKLLIADEPTTALDVTIQAQILEIIRDLQAEEDMAVLFITHDMGVVAEIADRTVVMFRGDVVETGPTAQVFAAPAHPYSRALLSAIPKLGQLSGTRLPARFWVADPVTGVVADQPATRDTVDTRRPVLDVCNLTTRFDISSGFVRVAARVHAVENVSFRLHPGETLSLVGESGCGKSTTGRSIMRLTPANSGSVFVDGEDVLLGAGVRSRESFRRVQMIFQDPFASLNPRRSIGAAIAEPLLVHGMARRAEVKDHVADLLQKVGLPPEVATRFPHEFSGGQRQRISIARALALEPKVIIADEAVSALDASIKAQVSNLMLDLQDRLGVAYLFISHDMAVVERMSHRVAVMYLGEIVEIGPRAAVFDNPQHPYTQKLIAAVPQPDPARRGQMRPPAGEIRSAVRAADYVPPVRQWRQVGPDHLVMETPDAA